MIPIQELPLLIKERVQMALHYLDILGRKSLSELVQNRIDYILSSHHCHRYHQHRYIHLRS